MPEETTKKYRKYFDIAFAAFFAAVTALYIRKVPYGFHFFDEANWLALSDRLMRGDALLYDDWTLTQIPLVILYPLVRLYHAVFGGNEGIIITFRYIFVFFHCVNTIALYLMLRKKSPVAALCAVMLYFPFSHLYIAALSYYTMALDFMLLACAVLAVHGEKKIGMFAGGLLFALAVIEDPYLAALYAAYCIACVVCAALKKRPHPLLGGRGWLCFTCGCAVPAVIFAAFVLSRASVTELIGALPHLFGDEKHSVGGNGSKVWSFFTDMIERTTVPEILLLVPAAAYLIDRGREKRKGLYASALALFTVCAVLINFRSSMVGGMLTLSAKLTQPFAISGISAYIMSEKKDGKTLCLMYLPGWAFALCMYLASDTGYSVVNTPLMVCACAGACFMCGMFSELRSKPGASRAAKLIPAAIFAAAMLAQTGYELYYVKNYCFSEPSGTSMMFSTIDYGIGKGEKTTENTALYEQDGLWEATAPVRDAPGDYVLYFSDDCWPYLEDSKKCASFAVWIQRKTADTEAERLLDYWEMFPEKKPDAIYVSKNMKNVEDIIEKINTENFPVEENERGYVLIRPQE